MRELLISYLLGELSADEAARLEAQIEADPRLQEQLAQLRRCLPCDESSADALDEASDQADENLADELPAGLADRTADSVHDLVLGLSASSASSLDEPDPPSSRSNFTLVDAMVAGGVVMALGMMLFPALQESRESSRRLTCEYHLGQVGKALRLYAAEHGGLLPHIHPGENAGMYSVRLADAGYIDRDELASAIVCPASSLGQKLADSGRRLRIPQAAELEELDRVRQAVFRRLMGGSYAYRLGYLDGPLYHPIVLSSKCGSSYAPMLSDAPHPGSGRWQSSNHGGCGQNVLFQDGSVRYQSDCLLREDNLFVNTAGAPAAGSHWNDAVLVSSDGTPGVLAAPGQPRRFRLTIWRIQPSRQLMPQGDSAP